MRRIVAALMLASAPLSACGDRASYEGEDAYTTYEGAERRYDGGNYEAAGGGYGRGYFSSDEREPFDEDLARDAAEQDLASEGYDYSYGCSDDCSGHEAGWQWRAENGYSTYGNSQSFDEGAYAFEEAVEDRVEEMRDDYEAGVDPDY